MALTRAMLLMGNSANGVVLPGQPTGVIAGAGITIDAGGIISVNAATAVGVMRLNNPGAYNAYVWPLGGGTLGQQLTSDGAGNLGWSNPSGILWTAKGQLVVGTGVNTDIILNAGANTAVLMADTTTASGLTYSNLANTAIQVPAGTTLQQPSPPVLGQLRYNTDNDEFEGYLGAPPAWAPIGGALPWTALGQLIVGTGVDTDTILNVGTDGQILIADSAAASGLSYSSNYVSTTGPTGVANMPAGSTGTRPITPSAGGTRYNSTTTSLEFWDGAAWSSVTSSSLLGLGLTTNNIYTVAKVTEAAVPPTPGTGQTQAILGSTYYDTNLGQMFTYYSNGGSPVWVAV